MQDVIYLKPENLKKALYYLAEYREACLWAGGTDLVVKLERKSIRISQVIDLKSIRELSFIKDDDQVRIGALTTIHDIEVSPVIKNEFPLLAQAAHVLGSWQIRTLATIGGNLMTAAPSAETATPILILGGTLIAQSKHGDREIPARLFFRGPGKTALIPGEILKEIQLPRLPQGYKSVYLKESLRRSMDIALVSVACVLKLDGDRCQEVRLGLGAVAPVPMRATKTEELLTEQIMNEEIIEKAAKTAANECQPIDDIRATAAYRRKLVQVLVKRALTSLWKAGAD